MLQSQTNIDVLFIQDTQLTITTAHWQKAELKQELGDDCYIIENQQPELLHSSLPAEHVSRTERSDSSTRNELNCENKDCEQEDLWIQQPLW